MKFLFSIILIFLALNFSSLQAQQVKPQAPEGKGQTTIDQNNIELTRKNWNALPQSNPSIFDVPAFEIAPIPLLVKPTVAPQSLEIKRDATTQLPVWIKGNPDLPAKSNRAAHALSNDYLNAIGNLMQMDRPMDAFVIHAVSEDVKGRQHIRMQQMHEGVKVYGSEIILHEKDGIVYLFNGRYYLTPDLETVEPNIDANQAADIVQAAVSEFTNYKELNSLEQQLIPGNQIESELVVYHLDGNHRNAQLAWHVIVRPNVVAKYEYFVDAISGEVLHHFNGICQIHGGRCSETPHGHAHTPEVHIDEDHAVSMDGVTVGPATATATDLKGINRTINVYEDGGTYFMIDASRPMFNASLSDIPNEPVGAVWTIDGYNNSPQNNNFQPGHVVSNNNTWNNPTAVSAHYNGGEAYEYFDETFNRNSINGQGGTIVSLINITDSDGSQMDNAYWNGAAMFYGNGNQAFEAPLAKATDVAGHEMAHGVIQSTANLTYQNESGALNESFADIFGAMIDRDDWQIGEEVVSNVFPSGTMRDMANPHNGGSSINDFYWQPDHYSERFTGGQDNGGVHINSGIPNHAYYLFASAPAVGKDKAEQVYYIALRDFLTASSNFADLRNAIVEVAQNEYGASVANAAAAAFDDVGIGGSGGSGPPPENQENNGDEYILFSTLNSSDIVNLLSNGSVDQTLSNTNHISKPSVSDNGVIINFVGTDNHIWEIDMDWSTGSIIDEYTLTSDPVWRNVATSKDGSKIAAVTTDYDNQVFVYDFNSGNAAWFELYNPTYSTGVTTGDVDYADVLEFDITGEYLMYDAQNTINGDFGEDITYWDIGFIRVWNNVTNDFSNGNIEKLFTGLPENVSVGNPTFSKKSPYIIAIDYIEQTTSGIYNAVVGVNLETFDQGLIWENNKLGYPSYSVDDSQLIFSVVNVGADIIGVTDLNNDKITGSGSALVVVENAEWAVWYATGDRVLVNTEEVLAGDESLSVYPNPFDQTLTVEYEAVNSSDGSIEVFDLMGKKVYHQNVSLSQGLNKTSLTMNDLPAGTYLLRLNTADRLLLQKVSKF